MLFVCWFYRSQFIFLNLSKCKSFQMFESAFSRQRSPTISEMSPSSFPSDEFATNFKTKEIAFLFPGHDGDKMCHSFMVLFAVPSAPSDIKAVTSGENSVIVSWRSPAHTNGLIQKYTVFRREINTGQEVQNIDLLFMSRTFIVFHLVRWTFARVPFYPDPIILNWVPCKAIVVMISGSKLKRQRATDRRRI